MKATSVKDSKVINLPVPLGTPVYIQKYSQHDDEDYALLVEYSYEHLQLEVFLTRDEAEHK